MGAAWGLRGCWTRAAGGRLCRSSLKFVDWPRETNSQPRYRAGMNAAAAVELMKLDDSGADAHAVQSMPLPGGGDHRDRGARGSEVSCVSRRPVGGEQPQPSAREPWHLIMTQTPRPPPRALAVLVRRARASRRAAHLGAVTPVTRHIACAEPSREVRAGSREVRAHAVRSASPVVWVRCAEAAHPASPTPARPSAPPTHARHLRTDAS